MTKWHETLAANIGLRLAGLALLFLAWLVGHHLFQIVQAHLRDAPAPLDMVFAGLTVLAGSAGSMLLFVGPGLWAPVRISDRWTCRSPGTVPPAFDENSAISNENTMNRFNPGEI